MKDIIKLWFILGTIFCSIVSTAQDSLNWINQAEFIVQPSSAWAMDILGNSYSASNGVVSKYDATGKVQFSQSLKQIGMITSISPVNTMKVILFSEDQQSICFLDNTLSFTEECIDLDRFSIGYATFVIASNQSDRFWVFDQINNTLNLINWNTKVRLVELTNLTGTILSGAPIGLKERDNSLFVADAKKIVQFDRFGSLIGTFTDENIIDFEVSEQYLIVLTKNSIHFIDRRTAEKWEVISPVKEASKIAFDGHSLYFLAENKVKKYTYSKKN